MRLKLRLSAQKNGIGTYVFAWGFVNLIETLYMILNYKHKEWLPSTYTAQMHPWMCNYGYCTAFGMAWHNTIVYTV